MLFTSSTYYSLLNLLRTQQNCFLATIDSTLNCLHQRVSPRSFRLSIRENNNNLSGWSEIYRIFPLRPNRPSGGNILHISSSAGEIVTLLLTIKRRLYLFLCYLTVHPIHHIQGFKLSYIKTFFLHF